MAANPDSLRISDDSLPDRTVAFARGDGIGPEISDAVLAVMEAAGARLDLQEVSLGRAVYESGTLSGVDPAAWDVLRGSRAFLKAPVSTPQGGGFKSVNVTVRKSLGLFAAATTPSSPRATRRWTSWSCARTRRTPMRGSSTVRPARWCNA